ncbi:MAG: XdhC family protein [Anaerolineae bacterium]|jgi:xanthine dehydrogenase accessory factor
MRGILDDLIRWLAAGESIALATVVGADGSSPRPVGSRMAVTASGEMSGSVSGGCVEGDVLREAQRVLGDGEVRRLRYTAAEEEGWEVGLACGGTIDVFVEPFTEIHRTLTDALGSDESVGMATRLDGEGHLLAWPDGRLHGDRSLTSQVTAFLAAEPSPSCTLQEGKSLERDIFLEVFARPPTLTIVGAVHIAVPLVTMAQVLGFRVRLVDARRAFATRDRFPSVDDLVVAWPIDALRPQDLRPRDAVVVLTHDPKFDVPALEVALRSPVGYIGLLGSTTTQEARREALRKKGFGDESLELIHGPVGLDLGGRRPAEIALAILGEIVSMQNQ